MLETLRNLRRPSRFAIATGLAALAAASVASADNPGNGHGSLAFTFTATQSPRVVTSGTDPGYPYGPEDSFTATTTFSGTAAHTGRFTLVVTSTFFAYPFADEYGYGLYSVSDATLTAANGDQILLRGGYADFSSTAQQLSFAVVGGTGRFEDATGGIIAYPDPSQAYATSTVAFYAFVSSVGANQD